MSEVNKNIDDFLDYYYSFKQPPEYAVMIKGPWGTGKSWFIQRALGRLKDDNGKYLYVSLYGMTSFDDIENAFFQQMHPVLSSKGMQLTSKLVKGLLKATIKLDLDNDGSNETSAKVSIDDLNISDYLNDTENFVLVFDDLERCSIDISDILGYINQFVEHHGYKVIIVANEDEIIKGDDNDDIYSRIKEKLIGKTFEIQPDVNEALNHFIEMSSSEEVREFYQTQTDLLTSMYNNSKYKNLRHLKQALWDFERLYLSLPESTVSKNDLKVELLKLFLAYSFEIRNGKIKSSQISRIKGSMYSGIFDNSEVEKKKSLYSVLSTKYPMVNFSEPIIDEGLWDDFLDKGLIEPAKIQESIEKSKYYQSDNTPNWVKLWHYHDLSDDDFSTIISAVNSEITEQQFSNYNEVKHLAGLFLKLSDIELIPETKNQVLTNFLSYIDYLKDNNLLPTDYNGNRFFIDNDQWGGLGFSGRDIPEFKQFSEYLDRKLEESKIDNLPNVSSMLVELMRSDIRQFTLSLIISNNEVSKYYKTPILKNIDANLFVNELLSISGESFRQVGFMFKERYEAEQYHQFLKEELEWLIEIKTILDDKKRELKGKVSGYRIGLLLESYIEPAIDSLS